MSKQFSLSKILVICFFWDGELSYEEVLIFFGYFFDRSGSLNYCYFLGRGASRGVGGERGKVHEDGTGCSHVALLSAAETAPFFETFFLFLWGELSGFLFGIYIHGIGILGGSVPGGGGGVECDWGSG